MFAKPISKRASLFIYQGLHSLFRTSLNLVATAELVPFQASHSQMPPKRTLSRNLTSIATKRSCCKQSKGPPWCSSFMISLSWWGPWSDAIAGLSLRPRPPMRHRGSLLPLAKGPNLPWEPKCRIFELPCSRAAALSRCTRTRWQVQPHSFACTCRKGQWRQAQLQR